MNPSLCSPSTAAQTHQARGRPIDAAAFKPNRAAVYLNPSLISSRCRCSAQLKARIADLRRGSRFVMIGDDWALHGLKWRRTGFEENLSSNIG
ncbi:hypothetical protein M0R45_006241 [Rubus argutus]|uniref:Uncharacterized protein n=1 Tax=Rubus argutus TaxID=59490 RepID=A0AAW1YPX1_RUBAR